MLTRQVPLERASPRHSSHPLLPHFSFPCWRRAHDPASSTRGMSGVLSSDDDLEGENGVFSWGRDSGLSPPPPTALVLSHRAARASLSLFRHLQSSAAVGGAEGGAAVKWKVGGGSGRGSRARAAVRAPRAARVYVTPRHEPLHTQLYTYIEMCTQDNF